MKKNYRHFSNILLVIFVTTQVSLAKHYSGIYQSVESHETSPPVVGLHFASYFHLRYSFVQNDPINKINEDHWSLRRFKLIANWKLNDRFHFFSQFIYKTNNYSDTDDRVYLQHAFMKLFFIKQINFKIGQFKPPFGWERFQPDFQLPEVERSQAIDRLIPNGSEGETFARDYGLQFFGTVFPDLEYEAALMTGVGAHAKLSGQNFPLIVGRMIFNNKFQEPLFHQNIKLSIQLAYSQRWNTDIDFTKQLPGYDKNIFQQFNGRDKRYNAAIAINTTHSLFVAEYLAAEFIPNNKAQINRRASGWFVKHSHFLSDHLQYTVRYEQFDPQHSQEDNHDLSWLTLGFAYYFDKNHDRLMVSYIQKNEAKDELKNDMLVLQLQYFLFGGQ